MIHFLLNMLETGGGEGLVNLDDQLGALTVGPKSFYGSKNIGPPTNIVWNHPQNWGILMGFHGFHKSIHLGTLYRSCLATDSTAICWLEELDGSHSSTSGDFIADQPPHTHDVFLFVISLPHSRFQIRNFHEQRQIVPNRKGRSENWWNDPSHQKGKRCLWESWSVVFLTPWWISRKAFAGLCLA